MGETFVIRGFWGPRAEGDAELPERVRRFLGRLNALRPGPSDTWARAKDGKLDTPDSAGLARYVHKEAEQVRRESDRLPVVLVLSAKPADGTALRVTIAAGSTGMKNSAVVKFSPSAGDVDAQLAMARDALVALVEEWGPDWGDIYTYQLDSGLSGRVEERMESPSAGYSLYLSSHRWAAARAVSLPGRLEELAGGGVVSLDGEPGSLPSVDQVVALDQALASTAAFEPGPLDRPHLGGADPVSRQEPSDVPRQEADHNMKLTLKYQPVAENAPLFARDIVGAARQIAGLDLDYSVASLRHVDDIIEDLRRDGTPADAIGETLFGFGTYVGEVLVRNAGAVWTDFDEAQMEVFDHALGIEMPGGAVWNPLGKVFKRFANGAEDSLEFFYAVSARPR